MQLNYNDILVLAPHTDDGEFGCGGTIARFVAEGKQVYYVAFSIARTSVRPELPENILELEVKAATIKLGISPENLIILDFPVRRFPEHRQGILEALVRLENEINPDLILLPSAQDVHQDHQVIAAEGLRAFKRQTILGYEEPWNNIVFETRCLIALEKQHIAKKIEAVHAYRSQNHRAYFDDEFIWSLARVRGTQIETNYAEAFEVLRWVVR